MEEMRDGWDARVSCQRTAAALVVLTLLPVAAVIGSAPSQASPVPSPLLHTSALESPPRAHDYSGPAVEALRRGQTSGLFAPFAWDGRAAYGPFVRFEFAQDAGRIMWYSAVNGSEVAPLVDEVYVEGFHPSGPPMVAGPTFVVSDNSGILTAHDEPMALLEFRAFSMPKTVLLQFPSTGTTITEVSNSTGWPRATLAFSVRGSQGRLILGEGTFNVSGTTVVASLAAWGYLAMKTVPGFASDRIERAAVLDAFGSGRLVAEYGLVAMKDGGWIQNAADFRGSIQTSAQGVEFNKATIQLGAAQNQGGLILVAFDPQTMPVDSQHRLAIRVNGIEVSAAADALGSLYATQGPADRPVYARLSMNATVLVVYIPDLRTSPLEVESLALAAPTIDTASLTAMIAAVGVVSLAAALMFRRRPD